MRRFLIHHGREGTWDLLDEDGMLTVERYSKGMRERLTLDQFERSDDGKRLAAQLRGAVNRARQP